MWDSITIAANDAKPVTCRFLLTSALLLVPLRVLALDLAMPAPVQGVVSRAEPVASYALPVGPFRDGTLPVRRIEGALDQRAFRLATGGKTLTEIASPLRAALEAQGFTVILDCETRDCGGFDFRFATEVMPEPGMHVDLGEFRFIAAEKDAEVISLLISRSGQSGFVQMTRVGAVALPAVDLARVPVAEQSLTPKPEPVEPEIPTLATPVPTGDVIGLLQAEGHVALDDLVFASGKAVLEPGDYASLKALAAWLKEDASRTIVLVGHTDGSGALAANVALSKKRAEGVRQVLMTQHDVAPAQVSAEGAGPLAPRASNGSEDGRRKNRRVEAIQTSTQ